MLQAIERILNISGHSTYIPSFHRSRKIKIDENEIIANVNITGTANDLQSRPGFAHPMTESILDSHHFDGMI